MMPWSDGWLNFSFTARSAILLYGWGIWLTHLQLPAVILASQLVVISFQLRHSRVRQSFASKTMHLWNRCFMDYFLCVEGLLQLDAMEAATVAAYRLAAPTTQVACELFGELPHRRRSRCGHFYRHMHMPLRWYHAAGWS